MKKKAALIKKAESSVSVTKKVVGEEEVATKKGSSPDLISKINPSKPVQVGMSKGATINMGNYESLRVDAWLTDEAQEDETVEQAFERVENILDSVLEPYAQLSLDKV